MLFQDSWHTVVSSSGMFPKGRILFVCVLGLAMLHQDLEKVLCLTMVSKIDYQVGSK